MHECIVNPEKVESLYFTPLIRICEITYIYIYIYIVNIYIYTYMYIVDVGLKQQNGRYSLCQIIAVLTGKASQKQL